MLDRLFLYGTLMVGHCRWPILEPFVAGGLVAATANGRLYDTGRDYPAARFDDDGTIHGQLARLRTDRLDEALAVLDEVEGAVHGFYTRVVIRTGDGTEAWAYEFGLAPDGLVDLDGRWTGV